MKVCRICLSKDGRLYPITSYGLCTLYHQLIGVVKQEIDTDKGLPQWVCAECGLRLMSYNKLRQKSLRSHHILTKLLDKLTYITEEDINKIDREKNNLQSNLSYNVLDQGNIIEHVDIPETDKLDCKSNVKIQEILIDIDSGETSSVFKTEKDSDEFHSETAAVSDYDSDFKCDSDSSSSVNKLLKKNSSRTLKPRRKKAELNVKKKVDKYYNSLQKKSARRVQKQVKKEVKSKIVKKRVRKNTKNVKKELKTTDPDPIEDIFSMKMLSLEEQMVEFEKRKFTKNYVDAPFKCNDCFKGFNTEVTFARHNLTHSDEWGKIECKICKIRFRLMPSYCHHMQCHKTIYSCKECDFTSSRRSVALLHRLKHKGKVYKCPHCEVEFVNKSSYLSHLRIKHVSEFVCEYCGYSFVSASGVDQHKAKKHALHKNHKVVSIDGPACKTCKIRFASDEALSTHLRVSHLPNSDQKKRNDDVSAYGARKVVCEVCGVKSANSKAYSYHFRHQHPDLTPSNFPARPKPYMCEQCGRVFQKRGNLLSHALVHTRQKPFECHDCNKRFKSKLRVQTHIQNVHLMKNQNKVYSCGMCDKVFNDPSNRLRHIKYIHTVQRPFNCEICGSSFKTKGAVKLHTTHVHLKKPWPKKNEQGTRHNIGW